jgi:hypothetical protein
MNEREQSEFLKDSRAFLSQLLSFSIAAGVDRRSRYLAGEVHGYCSRSCDRLREIWKQNSPSATLDGAEALLQLLQKMEAKKAGGQDFDRADVRAAFVIQRRMERSPVRNGRS